MADVAGAFRLREGWLPYVAIVCSCRAMAVCRIDGAGIHYWVTDAR